MSTDSNHNSEQPDAAEEIRLASFLRTTDADSLAPDSALLASLRQRTIDQFTGESPTVSRPAKLWRGLIALLATAAVVLVGLFLFDHNSARGEPHLTSAIEEVRQAKTLQLKVTKQGDSADVWVSAPGKVRWEESPQQYKIANGSRWWKIDETENAASLEAPPANLDARQPIDLLKMLNLGIRDESLLLAAGASDTAEYAGKKCTAYRAVLAGNDQRYQIIAFADAATNQFLGIEARPFGAPAIGPPLAAIQLVAMNTAVDDSKFVVAKSLTEDGRIGKIVDSQGLVVLRPALAGRWTPVDRETLLRMGDWLRTDIRGANAAKIRLSSEVELTLGPGTLMECISPTKARLHTGEVQSNLPRLEGGMTFELHGPRDDSRTLKSGSKELVRVERNEKLVDVKEDPIWLKGFEGTSNSESLGSLIVNLPDGGTAPLSVGYHKVNVEIRDQIARTTIEESFVNHTPARLEGVFYFPLPQDASISGFGMWIGNDLIEADVVEKQRAREIYETILREKRDPGLLEWTSGNLFKARVFPIEAHSEKRIKIVYTQVLPLRANRYRYSYGLRSELLRTTPLRELSVSVQVNSALPLKNVACPTHTVRAQQTAHSAQVDFAAQEYIPDRDFEVVCEIDGRNSDVVVVPHRRGDDGYLLLQVTPPGKEGNWQREILPDGKPLQLVLLCDTSASMDSEKRKQQAEFVATVLSSLGEKDRFMLAVTDVEITWLSPEAMAATQENITKARELLDGRVSLGWTNLDQAFAVALKQAPADANVIYIGDGMVTAGEADPVSFVKHLGQLIAHSPTVPVGLHAVSVGNTSDSTVLRGIAGAGHGSVRAISGEQTPQNVAKELLNEIAQPGLRDLNVEFRGVKVAAVYPDQLPQVPAGTQQILVGRYLPTGKDQHGEVIVTGKLGGEPVRYATQIDFKDADNGNSFIPRLWARAHLDHLLAQGQSAAIRDSIIALSEQFHIITPYTSLLVLETDADRERFGVKRRFEMRDGEKFFAEGRANANFELFQQQMKRAGDWRIGLRRQVLANLMTLGRNQQALQQQIQVLSGLPNWYAGKEVGFASPAGIAGALPIRGPMGGSGFLNKSGEGGLTLLGANLYAGDTVVQAENNWGFNRRSLGDRSEFGIGGGGGGSRGGPDSGGFDFYASGDINGDLSEAESARLSDRWDVDKKLESGWQLQSASNVLNFDEDQLSRRLEFNEPTGLRGTAMAASDLAMPIYETKSREIAYTIAQPVYEYNRRGGRYFDSRFLQYPQSDYTAWLNTLFPALGGPPPKPVQPKISEGWTAEARTLAGSLLRTESLQKLAVGLEIRRTDESFDPRWNRRAGHHTELDLYSPKNWLTRPTDLDGQTLVNFCDEKERGVYSLALLLGSTRKSVNRDLTNVPFSLNDWSLARVDEAYSSHKGRVEPAGDNRTMLVVSDPNSKSEIRFLIDTTRHVLLKQETLNDGKLSSTIEFGDFVEIGGAWWARTLVTTDAKGRKTGETKIEIKSETPEQFAARMSEELAAKSQVEMLQLPFVPLKVARQKVADGSAGFDDRITMMLYDASLQQWDDLFHELDAAEKVAAGKPGVKWLRPILLATARRNDDARKWLLNEAKELAAKKQQDEIYLADFVFGQAQSVASPAEQLEFIEALKPVTDRQPAELDIGTRWQERTIGCDDALGRIDESLALRRLLAEHLPWDIGKQSDYARHLLDRGQAEKAYAWLQAELDRKIERSDSEDEQLRTAYADLYRTQARWDDLLKFTTAWIKRNPPYQSAYSQHLSALVFNDQLESANKHAEQWLKDAQMEAEFSPDQSARLEVAISFAQGNCHNLWFNRMDDRWYAPLAETVRFFLAHKKHFDIAQRIFDNRLAASDEGDRLRGDYLTLLQTELDSLTPQQVVTLVSWSLSGRMELSEPIDGRTQLDASEIPTAIWQAIAKNIRQGWNKTTEKTDKHLLGDALQSIYSNRFSDTELLPFLRERIKTAADDYKGPYIAALFETLLTRNWNDDNEQEAFQLLPQLSPAEAESQKLLAQVPALNRLVDAMISGRQAAADRQMHDEGKVNELTRTELAKKKAEFAKSARIEIAKRLGAEATKLGGPLAPWLRMEQAYLDVQLDQNLPAVEEMCWKLLGEVPPKSDADAAGADTATEMTAAQLDQQFFDALLRQRAYATVMNLAARRNATPATIKRVQQYIDAGIAQRGDAAALWRVIKFQLLVALDQPDELEKQLRTWIRDDVSTAPWRNALAMLLAERGKLDEAISLFEAVEKDHLLSAADFRMLSDWYLVTQRREAHDRAILEAYKTLPENVLANTLYGLRNRWMPSNRPLPSELDENTLLALRALFEKSAAPENYSWQLRELYGACRDFRLLQILPDAVLGRSPQQIYSLLQNLNGQILGELRNEATADEIIARIKTLRDKQTKPTDLRALDLFESMIERRSAEVLNQPGPHVEACVAAMKRAFDRQWGDGELKQMASFLKNLGTLPKPPMVDEQLRELRALQSLAAAGSRDHLQITNDLCNLMFWAYGRQQEAIAEMEIEVRGYEQGHQGNWPNEDNGVLGDYVHLLEGAHQHAAGEKVLDRYLAHPENDQQRNWLRDRMLALYNDALANDGEVSLGKGNELFLNIVAEGMKQLDAASDENIRHGLVARLVGTFDIAHKHRLSSADDELRKFAFETMAAVLKRQQGQYRNTVTAPLNVVAEALGPKFALQYIVERLEQYPQRLEISWDSGWNVFGYELARRRQEASDAKLDLTDLEPRVLELAVTELQRELRTGDSRNPYLFNMGWGAQYFWAAKSDDFARAAEEVYTSKKSSGRAVGGVANYLWNGLHRFPRAIEILFVAYHNGVLDEGGQVQLVNWLHEQNRHAESIAILEPLVKARPDYMHYRCLLMTAYFRSLRAEQLRDLVAQTDAHFHEGGRWTEGNVAEFGRTCVGSSLPEKAMGYLSEAIALHQRSHGERTLNDGELSSLYQALADAHSALGHTKDAVDAASSAIVCWGPQQPQRRDAMNKLKQVLEAAKDLADYVALWNAETEKTGQDSPITRKAIAQAFQTHQDYAHAATQFELAIQLQPTDREAYEGLIACDDALGKRDEATRQMERLIEIEQHDLKLYQQLADRLKDSPAEAERAITSIIEVGSQEAENHIAVAEIRERQDRWDDAIHQWEEVAKLRALEPTGLLKLAEAQIHQKQWDDARQSIQKLQRAEWPTRFGDVSSQSRQLEQRLPK